MGNSLPGSAPPFFAHPTAPEEKGIGFVELTGLIKELPGAAPAINSTHANSDTRQVWARLRRKFTCDPP